METLTIEGREFVKASKVARDFGYTADYVGQLCRGGKVEAELVGRSWYVELNSLQNHKDNRYKATVKNSEPQIGYQVAINDTEVENNDAEASSSTSSTAVSFLDRLQKLDDKDETKTDKVAIKKPEPVVSAPMVTESDKKTTSVRESKTFYNRVPTPAKPADYENDDSDLIPSFKKDIPEDKKTANLKVGLADATSVKITTSTTKYDFITPKRPRVHFKGSLAVDEIYDPDPITLPPENEESSVKNDSQTGPDSSSGTVAVSAEELAPEGDRVPMVRKTNYPQKRIAMRRQGRINRNPTAGTLEMPLENDSNPETSSSKLVLVITTFVALFLVMAALGFERHLVAETGLTEAQETVVFSIDELLAAVYGSK